jgi:hypothetical protein
MAPVRTADLRLRSADFTLMLAQQSIEGLSIVFLLDPYSAIRSPQSEII